MAERTTGSGRITTVLGPVGPDALGIVDAHGHVWVDAVPGAPAPAPALADREPILAELRAFRAAGGGAIVDCQLAAADGTATSWPTCPRRAASL